VRDHPSPASNVVAPAIVFADTVHPTPVAHHFPAVTPFDVAWVLARSGIGGALFSAEPNVNNVFDFDLAAFVAGSNAEAFIHALGSKLAFSGESLKEMKQE